MEKPTWREGPHYPVRLVLRISKEHDRRIKALAQRWGMPRAAALRRCIDDRYVSEFLSNSGGSTVQPSESAA